MSYYPDFTDLAIEELSSQATVAKEIQVQYLNLVDVPDYQKRSDYLVYIQSVDTYYRWNTSTLTWNVAINAGGGGIVDSVTAGNTSISIGGTLDNPTVSTAQNITTTANILFNSLNVTDKPLTRTNLGLLLNNYSAIVDPTITDDSSLGYAIGSKWINTVLKRAWECVNATLGASIWSRGVSLISELDDVDVTGIQTTDVLAWNGVKFAPAQTMLSNDVTSALLLNCDFNALFSGDTTVLDSSAYASIGTLSNLDGTNLVAGKLNSCLYFDANNNLVNFSPSSHLNFGVQDAWTVNFWFKTSATDATTRTICGNADGTNTSGWKILYHGSTQRFEFQLSDLTTTRNLECRWTFGSGISDSNWHFISVVHNGGLDGNKAASMILYLDGFQRDDVKSITTNNLLNTDNIKSGLNFCIAGQPSGGNNLNNHYIDAFSILNYGIVPSSHTSLWNSGTGTESFANVTSVIWHNHNQNDVIGLVNKINTMDTTTSSKLASITSSNTNTLDITGTATAPILTNKVGAGYAPLILQVDTTLVQNTKFATTNNAVLGSATSLYIGRAPYNRSDEDYIASLYDMIGYHSLPCRLRVIYQGTPGTYAEFILTSFLAIHALYYQFGCVFDASKSTTTSLALNQFIKLMFIPKTQALIGTTNQINITNGNEDITLSLPNNILNIYRNQLDRVDIQEIRYGGDPQLPTTTYNSTTGSLDISYASSTNINDTLMSLQGNGYPRKLIRSTNNTKKYTAFAVKLTGASWTGISLQSMNIGFVTDVFLANIESNFTSGSSTFQLTYNAATTSNNRGYTFKFQTTNAWLDHAGLSWAATRTGYTTDSLALGGDILICTLENVSGSYNILLHWYTSAGVLRSTGSYPWPYAPPNMMNNTLNSEIIPVLNVYYKGAGYEFRILSQRELDTIVSLPTLENYFY